MASERIHVVRDDTARLADHVCVTDLDPERARRIDPCVHARHDRDPHRRRRGQPHVLEARGYARLLESSCSVALLGLTFPFRFDEHDPGA